MRRFDVIRRCVRASLSAAVALVTAACGEPVTAIEEADGWRAVVTTRASTCGIATDGRLVCWTLRSPDGLDERVLLPELRFAALSAGADGACALATDGRAFCWTNAAPATPRAVAPGTTFRQLSGSEASGCGITTQGATQCWTNGGAPAPLAGDPSLAAVSVGELHGCGLTAAGVAYCWGSNATGELGIGSRTPARSAAALPVATAERFVDVQAAAAGYSCARTAAGQARCWGRNTGFELGVGRSSRPGCESTTARSGAELLAGQCLAPQPAAPALRFTQLVATPTGPCGLTADGSAHCWGLQMVGSLGSAAPTSARCDVGGQYDCTPDPVAIAGAPRFAALGASSGFHRCATTSDAAVHCWGNVGPDGTPGRLSFSDPGQRVPVRLREPRL